MQMVYNRFQNDFKYEYLFTYYFYCLFLMFAFKTMQQSNNIHLTLYLNKFILSKQISQQCN